MNQNEPYLIVGGIVVLIIGLTVIFIPEYIIPGMGLGFVVGVFGLLGIDDDDYGDD